MGAPPADNRHNLAQFLDSGLADHRGEAVRALIAKECAATGGFPYQRGDKIAGRYEVRQVQAGGFGIVALCEYLGPENYRRGNRLVALKTPWPRHLADPEKRELFLEEAARCVALPPHSNLVYAYGLEEHSRLPFLIMECIPEARSLEGLILNGESDWRTALRAGLDVARGLEFAGLVHGDLKPANILIAPGGSAKVADFGLAISPGQWVDEAVRAGTMGFMAPEMFQGEPARTIATDVFAFGVTLYVTALRQFPFDPTRPPEGEPGDPRQHSDGVPPAFAELIRRCLAVQPASRPPTFGQISAELAKLHRELLRTEPVDAPLPDAPDRVEAQVNAAVSWLNLGRPVKAIQALNGAPKSEPLNWKVLATLARAHMEAGNLATARPLLEQAARLAPGEPVPLGNLATVAYQSGDRAAARRYFDEADRVARASGRLAELDPLSFLAIELRPPLEADAFLSALLKVYPLAAVTWNNRAILLRRAGLFAEALEHAEQALQANPTYAKAYVQKANALAHLQRHAEALEAAERSLSLDDSLIGAHVAAGMALHRLRRNDEARRRLERALGRWPGHETLTRALAAVNGSR